MRPHSKIKVRGVTGIGSCQSMDRKGPPNRRVAQRRCKVPWNVSIEKPRASLGLNGHEGTPNSKSPPTRTVRIFSRSPPSPELSTALDGCLLVSHLHENPSNPHSFSTRKLLYSFLLPLLGPNIAVSGLEKDRRSSHGRIHERSSPCLHCWSEKRDQWRQRWWIQTVSSDEFCGSEPFECRLGLTCRKPSQPS